MPNLSSKKLIELLEEVLINSATYRRIGKITNPFHIVFDGTEYYVYVKNLSNAGFKNSPDVWRAQMTGVDILNEIKESSAMFVLLGYDAENDIYATWNPHQLKQRIGTAKSPSLYSRHSLQEQVASTGGFKKQVLNNALEVLLFKRERITDYLVNIAQFFPDNSEYVAMGSRRRVEANNAYRELTSLKRVSQFEKFLLQNGVSEEYAHEYARAIRQLINDNLISKNRKIFLACDSLDEYSGAHKKFLDLDEIKVMDEEEDYLYSFALESYVGFLQRIDNEEPTAEEDEAPEEDDVEEPQDEDEKNEERDVITDWEAAFTDEQGNLTRIANPELLERLKPDLQTEYISLPSVYNTILEFYGDRFPNMQMKDWNNLFKNIDWDNPAGHTTQKAERAKRAKLWIQTPTGEVFNDNQVAKTFVKAIESVGTELVRSFGIQYLGDNLVTDTINENYAISMKPVSGGYYVNTNSSTGKKYELLLEINRHLEEIAPEKKLVVRLI